MSRTPQTLLAISASVASLALVAGCGSESKSATSASTTAAAKPGTASLYGTYERDVSKADIDRTDKIRSEAGLSNGSRSVRARMRSRGSRNWCRNSVCEHNCGCSVA